jgi:uncharacterized protein
MKSLFSTTICIFFVLAAASAQSLYMAVETDMDNSVLIRWIPLTPSQFDAGARAGYTLTRYDSTAQKTTVLSNTIVPKNIGDIEQLIANDTTLRRYYQTVYSWSNLNGSSAQAPPSVRYSLLMKEALVYPEVAQLLGLSWRDDSPKTKGNRYRYELQSNDKKGDGKTVVSLQYQTPFAFAQTDYLLPVFNTESNAPLRTLRQQNDPETLKIVNGQGQAHGDSVVLRWATKNTPLWLNSKNTGYRITRTEVIKGSSDKTTATTQVIKPATVAQCKANLKDSMVIYACQCLYGSKVARSSKLGPGEEILAESIEGTMAAFLADASATISTYLGLRFIDEDVEQGKRYLYQIQSLAGGTPALVEIDNKKAVAEKVSGLAAKQGDKAIELSWDLANKDLFTLYNIDKSEDNGKTFKSLTNGGLWVGLNGDEAPDYRITYVDSFPINYKPFIYRVSGLNAFGNWSPYSTVKSFGIDLTPPSQPFISDGTSYPNKFELTWLTTGVDTDLKGFNIYIANESEGKYQKINKQVVAKTARSYKHEEKMDFSRAYYFKVSALDTSGNESYSVPRYIGLIDSVGPPTPLGLKGEIDKKGIVRITWSAVKAADLRGYRVFVANDEKDVFVPQTSLPIAAAEFRDTLSLSLANKKICYKVMAEDENGNQSPYSKVLILNRPDTIPPLSPLLSQPASNGKSIDLAWTASPSDDVVQCYLYRSDAKDKQPQWLLLDSMAIKLTQFIDTTAQIEQIYNYHIVARDNAGNYSQPSMSVTGRRYFDGKTGGISDLQGNFDDRQKKVFLTWQIAASKDDFLKNKPFWVFIYRGKDGEPLLKYQQIESKNTPSFNDDDIEKGIYRYAARIVYDDGKITAMSKEIMVTIQ